MSKTQAAELDNRKDGNRAACPICNPRPDRVSMDRLWHWSLEHPGQPPFRQMALRPAVTPTPERLEKSDG